MRIVIAKTGGRVQRAFTMIEIAIALAVIGFALLAIVGLLPMGLTVQKDNREDTIISQDGAYFIEAIRGGVMGLDALTNYVDRIIVSNPATMGRSASRVVYINNKGIISGETNGSMTNGEVIVNLLSTPKYVPDPPRTRTNEVIAYVRALSGSAITQGTNNPIMAFQYQLRSEVTQFNSWDRESTNFPWPGTNTTLSDDEILERSNRWTQMRYLTNNLFDVRLRLSWPVLPNGNVSLKPKFQVFRTLISAERTNGIFDPQTYQFP